MSTQVFNRRWGSLILEALSRHNVRHLCIAPGSRSTPLTLSASENPKFICHTHFDERGLGHLALGLAKASKEPVGVIVTSGTAVANLYPALIEAGLTGERVVFITADRPTELIDCGANQAIRQQGIFASHPVLSLNLPRPTPDISASWLVSAVDSAMGQLTHGGLHINVPFAEPLYGDQDDSYLDWLQALGDWWQSDKPWLVERHQPQLLKEDDWHFMRQKKGVVFAGRMSACEGAAVAKWAKDMGWPLIGDVLSQTGQPLPCADLWLANPKAKQILNQAELVVQFGGSLTGKRTLQYQQSCQPKEYWLIDSLSGRLDPAQHRGRRIVADIKAWLAAHPANNHMPWAEELNCLSDAAQKRVHQAVNTQFGEAQLAHRFAELLPENGQIFMGNSLIVRLVDALGQLPAAYPIYSNRGASGIDGLISTAAGVQRASAKPTLALVGDISALYDINSLALLRQVSAPTVLIIVNNNGGQIFSLLPTPEKARQDYYCMPQNVDFRHAAALFDLSYASPTSWDELEAVVNNAWNDSGATVVELKVNDTDGAQTLKHLVELMAQH